MWATHEVGEPGRHATGVETNHRPSALIRRCAAHCPGAELCTPNGKRPVDVLIRTSMKRPPCAWTRRNWKDTCAGSTPPQQHAGPSLKLCARLRRRRGVRYRAPGVAGLLPCDGIGRAINESGRPDHSEGSWVRARRMSHALQALQSATPAAASHRSRTHGRVRAA